MGDFPCILFGRLASCLCPYEVVKIVTVIDLRVFSFRNVVVTAGVTTSPPYWTQPTWTVIFVAVLPLFLRVTVFILVRSW